LLQNRAVIRLRFLQLQSHRLGLAREGECRLPMESCLKGVSVKALAPCLAAVSVALIYVSTVGAQWCPPAPPSPWGPVPCGMMDANPYAQFGPPMWTPPGLPSAPFVLPPPAQVQRSRRCNMPTMPTFPTHSFARSPRDFFMAN
jgi:hypothetical protein